MDPTVELTEQDERDWRAERQEDIAAICWKECPDCNDQGHTVERWLADDDGPESIIRPTCDCCGGEGHMQLHDPLRVGALYDAADDARERMGVESYTRIAEALVLAISGAVKEETDGSGSATVESQTMVGKIYSILLIIGCDCSDAYHQAPEIRDIPACKHQIAVWLVRAAEKKMKEEKQFIREEKAYG